MIIVYEYEYRHIENNYNFCSDECLLAEMKKSESLDKTSKGVETMNEDADP